MLAFGVWRTGRVFLLCTVGGVAVLVFGVYGYDPSVPASVRGSVLNLRNNDTGGKDYNPITGVKYAHFEPTSPERHHARLAHPSITATAKTVER